MNHPCNHGNRQAATTPSFPLALADDGEKVKIVLIRGGSLFQERLRGTGVRVGDEIVVIQRQPQGAVLIEKSGNRYALGGGMAHNINVIRCSTWNKR